MTPMQESDRSYSLDSSLQIIVLIVSVACQMLAVCIISSTISRYTHTYMYVYAAVMVFAFIMIVIWAIAFFGAVKEDYGIMYFVWSLWLVFVLFWLFFISGCITPTRCSESLWLIDNMGRDHYRDDSNPEFYYHDYHRHVSDVPPPSIHELDPENKNKEPDHSLDYDEVPYIPHYEPVISFFQMYIPWSSKFGAVVYIVSLLLVLAFFASTLILLKKYANQLLSSSQFKLHLQPAVCSCNTYI